MAVYTASTSDNAPATDQQAYSFTETFDGDFRADAEYSPGTGGNLYAWTVGSGVATYARVITGTHTFRHDRVFYGDVDVSAKYSIGASIPTGIQINLDPPAGGGAQPRVLCQCLNNGTLKIFFSTYWISPLSAATDVQQTSVGWTGFTANTDYWLRLQRTGHTITVSVYTVDPIANPGAIAVATATATDQNPGYGFKPAVGGQALTAVNNLSIDDFRVVGTTDAGATWRWAGTVAAGWANGRVTTDQALGWDNPTYQVASGTQIYAIGASDDAQANPAGKLPEDVGGLAYHFRADDLIGVVADGANIATWPDRSGNHRDGVAVGTTGQPTLKQSVGEFAGHAAVTFEGDAYFELPTVDFGDDYFIATVWRRRRTGQTQIIFNQIKGSNILGIAPTRRNFVTATQVGAQIRNGPPSDLNPLQQMLVNGATDLGAHFSAIGCRNLPLARLNGAFYLDGAQTHNVILPQTTRAFDQTRIGSTVAQNSSQFAAGLEIAEIAVLTNISRVNRLAVMRGLMDRYIASTAEATAIHTVRSAATSDTITGTDSLTSTHALSPVSVTDSAAASDSAARAVVWARAPADNVTGTDAVVRSTLAGRSSTDTAAASDSTARVYLPSRQVSDTAGAGDSAARMVIGGRGPTDAVMAIDQLARHTATGRAAADTAAAVDTAARVKMMLRPATDTATAIGTVVFVVHRADPAQLTVTIGLEATIALSASSA